MSKSNIKLKGIGCSWVFQVYENVFSASSKEKMFSSLNASTYFLLTSGFETTVIQYFSIYLFITMFL